MELGIWSSTNHKVVETRTLRPGWNSWNPSGSPYTVRDSQKSTIQARLFRGVVVFRPLVAGGNRRSTVRASSLVAH
jgi:hypothetical protein